MIQGWSYPTATMMSITFPFRLHQTIDLEEVKAKQFCETSSNCYSSTVGLLGLPLLLLLVLVLPLMLLLIR